jgi:type IV pilus assembly protein PilF
MNQAGRAGRRRLRMRAKSVIVVLMCTSLLFCASAQQKAVKAREKDPKYQYSMGAAYLNQGNFDEAIKFFVKSLSLDTQYYLAWNGIGLAQSFKGNLPESAKAFEKCLEVFPGFTEAHNNLGMVYQQLGYLDKAEAEFHKALLDKTYPTPELPYYNLARLCMQQNRLADAYDYVQRAIHIKPRLAMAYNLKGTVLERQDRTDEAAKAYEEAVKLVPEDLLFSYNLAVAYFKTSDFAKAKEIFLKISPRVTDEETKDKIAQYLKTINERVR